MDLRSQPSVTINGTRLLARIAELAQIGAIEGTQGCSRLAFTDSDREGRDLVVTWMTDLGLTVTVDAVGNVVASTGDAGAAGAVSRKSFPIVLSLSPRASAVYEPVSCIASHVLTGSSISDDTSRLGPPLLVHKKVLLRQGSERMCSRSRLQ